jgi:glycosyltransferase involved in cell wall biosynthesis
MVVKNAMSQDGVEAVMRVERGAYVLVVPWELNFGGGVNEVVINLYRQIAKARHMEPIVAIAEWAVAPPSETNVDGRLSVKLCLRAPESFFGLMKWLVTAPLQLVHLVRFCRLHGVVAFNLHYSGLSAFPIAVARALRLYKGTLILTFHGLDLASARTSPAFSRALWKFVLRYSTTVVACSESLAEDVRAFAAGLPVMVRAIHNGVDVDDLTKNVDRTTELLRPLEGREFVLSVATFEPKKGIDVLLRAFVEVRAARPDVALVLVGRSSTAEAELRELARILGVADDVFFFPDVPHSRVSLFLERARAFCLPSRAEPFGIAICEAGAYRLPVVASRVGGIPEILTDGETGLLVIPDDVKGLASALKRVLTDRELARLLGEALYRRVTCDFTWERAYAKYSSLVSASRICCPRHLEPSETRRVK